LLIDIVSIIKQDGQEFDKIRASVQSGKIYIEGSFPLIESGDRIIRKMSNGAQETYLVDEPGFREQFNGIPAHYQIKAHKSTDSLTKQTSVGPGSLQSESKRMEPVEIRESIAKFRKDYPNSQKLAFILMQFGSSSAHEKILQAVKDALQSQGIIALRADDKEYHGNLLYNVLTYLYGCGFGIAIYERIESDRFNPNVSLEVGYMMALGKPVCLLKDRTLPALNTDLGGMLYRTFDVFDPAATIQQSLIKWLTEKGILGEHPVTDVPPIPHSLRPVTSPDEQGLDFQHARLASLSEEDRNAFLEDYQPKIDTELRKLPKNSRGIIIPLATDKQELAEAIAEIYRNAGWNAGRPKHVAGAWQVLIGPMTAQ
jgi:hypothetical protein